MLAKCGQKKRGYATIYPAKNRSLPLVLLVLAVIYFFSLLEEEPAELFWFAVSLCV